MNASSLARQAYAKNAAPLRTSRDTEYKAFAQITHRLLAAARKGKPGFNDLAAAVHDNRKLWSVLAADVADTANQLPDDLRANILSLAEFSLTHSHAVLQRKASAAPLIEINTAIMRGLRSGAS
ncbi:flagellar biosynthesis regulator FlaF [Cribrihabitans neustonicus]|uniref:flagellar biosynthesis regulator FlaF n=1 Tax=Cribrihabitans neustonicus TaxID=1429085 RepID=UPI003B5CE1F2